MAQLVAYRTLASWHSLCTNDSYIYKNAYPLYVLYMFQLKLYCVLCVKGSAHTGRCPSVHCQKQKNLSHMRTLLGKRLLKGDRVV
jgi:hypothetical protein